MNKCEHGQKITMFCASDCCVWKEAAGCEACMKKYHNHVGTTVFLREEEVVAIVKKYTMDNTIKPKCRVLQQAIYAHFNLLKNQLATSLDAACKNIINQIGYPYLYVHNTLSTYKRLKNKEYKKLIQKDFKALHELTQKISDKDLAKEESKIYVTEMKNTEDLISTLEDIVQRYQHSIKKYNPSFSHDTQHVAKINDILRSLTDSPRNSQVKGSPQIDKKNLSPVYHLKDKEKGEPLIKLEAVTLEVPRNERSPAIGPPPSLQKPNFSRDVSLDKKIVKQHKFVSNQSPVSKAERQRELVQKEETSVLSREPGPGGPRQKNQRMQSVRQQLNNKEIQINEKKKMLIEMMKQKEDGHKPRKDSRDRADKVQQSSEKADKVSESTSAKDTNRPKTLIVKPLISKEIIAKDQQLLFQQSQPARSMSNSQNNSKSQVGEDTGNHAFTSLPVEEKSPKVFEHRQKLKEKVIVVPQMPQSQEQELHSPLFKIKNIMDRLNNSSLMHSGIRPKPVEDRHRHENDRDQNILELIPIYHKKTETQMELKENEEKSLALLLKSLSMKAEEAIVYLQKAIYCADNNLSAVEYLSYLYLQLDRPADCLKLCNRMLQKIDNSNQPEEMSLILNNNKTAALNMLGRYSQSIVILERCLRYREKDYFYKNLGDAYFSISIYQKAIYNYEKALKLNDHHDEAHYNLAVCLYIQQNYHNAKYSIQKAIEINSLCEHYHELLTNIQTRISNY